MNNYILSYLVIINLYVFLLMFIDKRKSIAQKWRIPEKKLLLLGVIGGGIGGFLGQKWFRHKTQKKIFYICFFIGFFVDLYLLKIIYF